MTSTVRKTIRVSDDDMMEFLGLPENTRTIEIDQPVWDCIGKEWVIGVSHREAER
ncbi:MAG: hypothetical protein ACTSX2_05470 [Candidatus Thorarchaeota archaeon]